MRGKFCELWPLFAKLNLSVVRDEGLSLAFDRQHLPAFIIAAGGANRVTCDRAAALWTLAKLGPMPAVRGSARAQAHLRCFTFGDSHGERTRKAEFVENTNALSLF